MNDLLLRQVRPWGGAAQDIQITNGQISSIGSNLSAVDGTEIIDGNGAIAIPGLVDAHTHMDKTRLGLAWRPHSAGPTIKDKVDNERQILREEKHDPATQSAKQVRLALSKGTTAIRTHVDVASDLGTKHVKGVLETRDAFKEKIDIQIVAFPQQGMITNPGTAELLDAAIKMGADCVGGIDPSVIERDPVQHLDTIFAIADRNGVGVDIHLHEPGELGAFSLELIAERTKALGMNGNVVISHCFCLGMVNEGHLEHLLGLLIDNNIAIMTHAPGGSPFPPIQKLRDCGVRICSGNDGIQDAWSPYGNADMLERAYLLGYRSNFRYDAQIEEMVKICSEGGAHVMGLKDHAIAVGNPANLVLVEGVSLAEAVAAHRPRTHVIAKGKIVAKNGIYTE